MADDEEREEPPTKTEINKLERSQVELPTAPRGTNLVERARSYADRKYYQSRAAEVEAHTGMTRALDENLQSRTNLQRTMVESEEWDEEVERKRIRTQYSLEGMELDAALEQRKHELEMEARQRELERSPAKERKRSKSKSSDFRAEAENILRHGNAGPNLRAAKEAVDALIEERGGEDNLTEEDRERIEMLFEVARSKDFSKG